MSTKEWSVSYWHYMPGSSSPMQMMKGAMKCMQCGGVKEGETVLISTDTNKMRIAEALGGAAYAVGATPIIIMIPPVGVHGGQLPEPVVAAFREADVFLQPSTWSQTHTRARVEAIKAGKRGCTMCEVTEDALCVGAIEADYEECDRLGRKLGAALARSSEVRITTPLGTDIRGQVTGAARPVRDGALQETRPVCGLSRQRDQHLPDRGDCRGEDRQRREHHERRRHDLRPCHPDRQGGEGSRHPGWHGRRQAPARSSRRSTTRRRTTMPSSASA